MKAFLSWLWLIAVNLFYVAVVLYVFGRLEGRTEHLTVSILGLIYVTIRQSAISTGIAAPKVLFALLDEFIRVRRLLQDELTPEERDGIRTTREEVESQEAKFQMQLAFNGVVSLICLYQLFTTLGLPF